MTVKELIKILKKSPQNIDVDIYDIKDDCLGTIEEVWFPKTKLDKRDNNQVQITINRKGNNDNIRQSENIISKN